MQLSVQRIVMAGLLGALAIFLAVTRLGFIPIPNVTGNATIMHVPVILGAVLGGPVVGLIVGGIFGIFSFLQAENAVFADPLVSVLPRLFIGPMAYLAFAAVRRSSMPVALGAAAVVGTLTNTVLVLTMGVVRKLIPVEVLPTIVPQAVAEIVIAVILVVAIGMAAERTGLGGEVTSPRGASRTRA
ncbi:MAG: ECF transporter S component [Euzebyales bacterium]|nr:ECF transporter S component [Euzebyales bacterium]